MQQTWQRQPTLHASQWDRRVSLPNQITHLVNWKINLSRATQCGQPPHLSAGPTFGEQEWENCSCSLGLKFFFLRIIIWKQVRRGVQATALFWHLSLITLYPRLYWFRLFSCLFCFISFFSWPSLLLLGSTKPRGGAPGGAERAVINWLILTMLFFSFKVLLISF